MTQNKAPVAEVFYSLQGEGQNLGKPSIFVRFWGCNLNCCFCDTPYAVKEEKDKAINHSIVTLQHEINKVSSDCKHIVFTGGEPLLYSEFIENFIEKFHDYKIEIETNGTLPVSYFLGTMVSLFNVSVKLDNSAVEEYRRIIPFALRTFPKLHTNFKFVIESKNDILEVEYLVKQYGFKTYLMPKGVTQDEITQTSSIVASLCLKYNYNFSPRLHINLWHGNRGK